MIRWQESERGPLSTARRDGSANSRAIVERRTLAVPMRIDVFTIFPGMVDDFARESLLGKARTDGIVDLQIHDLRAAAGDPHRSVDDAPFGGGAGMVLMAEPLFAAVESAEPPRPLFLLAPGGRRFDQREAQRLATTAGFSLLCGRYEGVDERVREHLVDDELSIGDYVLAGGEVAAMVVIEAVARLVPGVMGNEASATEESFTDGLLEYPQYTRPADFRGWTVPDVLRSGDHGRIARWRRAMALARTVERRPDLLEDRGGLSEDEAALLEAECGITYDDPSPASSESSSR
jgi:tRNA (guanine37-N1)-methyltransferase